MTLRLQLRSVAASNISPQAASRFQNVAETHLVEQKNVDRTNVACQSGNIEQDGAKWILRYEPLHQHTSGGYKIAQATSVATWSAYGTAAYLSREHNRARVLAVAVPRGASLFPGSYGRMRRVASESRSFATIVAKRAPVPKSIPTLMPTKTKANISRASDVMRGRGVPSLPQEYREAKAEIDRNIREAESIRLRNLEEAKEQEVKRLQQAKEQEVERSRQQVQRVALSVKALDSRMVAIGTSTSLSARTFVNTLLTKTRINARLTLVEQRACEIALMILQEFSNVEVDSAPYSWLDIQENLLKAREQRLSAQLMLIEQRSHEIALIILQDFSDVEMCSAPYSLRNVRKTLVKAREERLNARWLRLEEQCMLIALAVAQARPENATIPTGLSLPDLLEKLNANRELRWTRLVQTIVNQKKSGRKHYKLASSVRTVDTGVTTLIEVAKEAIRVILPGSDNAEFLSKVMKVGSISKPLAGLVFALPSLQQTYSALDAHNFRLWNSVRLRNELVPEIFAFSARAALLRTKLADSLRLSEQISNYIMGLRFQGFSGRYNLIQERIRNLTDLLRIKANTARSIGFTISGFQFPCGNGVQDAHHLSHKELLEAELARIAVPINTMKHLSDFRDTADEIMDSDKYLYVHYKITDRLAGLRHELRSFVSSASVLIRKTHVCLAELIFWRGMQLQFQSLWGQGSFPEASRHLRTDLISSVKPRAISSPHSVRNEVEQHSTQQNIHSPTVEDSQSVGPMITYVTTIKYACAVLEDFKSSSILGFDILRSPRLRRVPSTSHRSQLQALVLANKKHIAIFHIALFESWDSNLSHIPALKEILESKKILKVGLNMTSHVQHLENHTTVEMKNFVDLNTCLTLHEVAYKGIESGRNHTRSGQLPKMITEYYDKLLASLRYPEGITDAGLVRASYIQCGLNYLCHQACLANFSEDLASGPYAALKVYNMSMWRSSGQAFSSAPFYDLQISGQFDILGRCPGKVTIDPYWNEGPRDSRHAYYVRELHVRSRLVSQVARSREICLNAIVDDLATAFIDGHLRARTKRERIQEKSKLEGRLQDLKALYLRIYFYESPEDILSGQLPFYSARRVLQLAKKFEFNIPPHRKIELEAEVLVDNLDPRERAEMWLESIIESESSNVRIAMPSEISSTRKRLLHDNHRDVLLLYAVWQVTSKSDDQIASLFSTTVEQMRSDVLLVYSLNLFHPVKHKLERLHALKQQTTPYIQDNLFPYKPSFAPGAGTSVRIEASRVNQAADKLGRSADPAYPADLRRRKEAAVATAIERRIRRNKRRRERREAQRTNNRMDRGLVKESQASNPAEQQDSTSPGEPNPVRQDTVEADTLAVPATPKKQAQRIANATLQPQPGPQPRNEASVNASINSSSKSGGRRRLKITRWFASEGSSRFERNRPKAFVRRAQSTAPLKSRKIYGYVRYMS